METPNYMDIKKIADFTITRITVDILKGYSDESINQYLEKYECQNVKELVYLFLCNAKPSDMNISLNMRQKIKNISDEVNQNDSENEQLNSQVKNLIEDKDALLKKVASLDELFIEQNKKVQEVMQINKTLTMKLQQKSKSDLGL